MSQQPSNADGGNPKLLKEYAPVSQSSSSATKVEDISLPPIVVASQPDIEDPGVPEQLIEFTFKIDGMTCVACSSSIERLMHNQFDQKEMQEVSIVLLTHKMIASFPQRVFNAKTVTPEIICNTVLMIGFGCELLSMTEITEEERKNVGQDGGSVADMSLDSQRIRGMDIEEESEYDFGEQDKTVATPTKGRRKSDAISDR